MRVMGSGLTGLGGHLQAAFAGDPIQSRQHSRERQLRSDRGEDHRTDPSYRPPSRSATSGHCDSHSVACRLAWRPAIDGSSALAILSIQIVRVRIRRANIMASTPGSASGSVTLFPSKIGRVGAGEGKKLMTEALLWDDFYLYFVAAPKSDLGIENVEYLDNGFLFSAGYLTHSRNYLYSGESHEIRRLLK